MNSRPTQTHSLDRILAILSIVGGTPVPEHHPLRETATQFIRAMEPGYEGQLANNTDVRVRFGSRPGIDQRFLDIRFDTNGNGYIIHFSGETKAVVMRGVWEEQRRGTAQFCILVKQEFMFL
ncbi:hypothetical protein FRC02_004419 [Tulasnella sp. 418]|nr:hypothetical protein FRC02_004419 [Tulasnella sp. 418]